MYNMNLNNYKSYFLGNDHPDDPVNNISMKYIIDKFYSNEEPPMKEIEDNNIVKKVIKRTISNIFRYSLVEINYDVDLPRDENYDIKICKDMEDLIIGMRDNELFCRDVVHFFQEKYSINISECILNVCKEGGIPKVLFLVMFLINVVDYTNENKENLSDRFSYNLNLKIGEINLSPMLFSNKDISRISLAIKDALTHIKHHMGYNDTRKFLVDAVEIIYSDLNLLVSSYISENFVKAIKKEIYKKSIL